MSDKGTLLDRILRRPKCYVGSLEKQPGRYLWKYDDNCEQMTLDKVRYVPALYLIFDQVLVKVAESKYLHREMDLIKVEINQRENFISVYNSGPRIPVNFFEENGQYVPVLKIGHAIPKLFSEKFIVETAFGNHHYKQVFGKNMSMDKPVTTECEDTQYWTRITFHPDLKTFGMECLDDDVVALMKKRVVDLAGCLTLYRGFKVQVVLNGKEIHVKSFQDYARLYLDKNNRTNPLSSIEDHMNLNRRWQISVAWSGGNKFKQVSFVNYINTIKGGTHVDYITARIAKCVIDAVKKKNKEANLNLHIVKNHLWVFVSALIDNPTFDNCMKETLRTPAVSSFRATCTLSNKFLKQVVDASGVVERLLSWVEVKKSKELVCPTVDSVSLLYGLQDTQRNVLFAAFKKNLVNRNLITVAELSDEISRDLGKSKASIERTIIGMAQNFVGANNISLFIPGGRFGTRYFVSGGKDAASPGYIFTNLTKITRFLFPREDDILPDGNGRYVPIIPMVLVNGAEQRGTGWSRFYPSYNPRHIIANLKRWLNSEPLYPMTPWYNNFRGHIGWEDTSGGANYIACGIIEEVNEDIDLIDEDVTIRITELPIKMWTDDYKEFLRSLATPNVKTKEAFIKCFCDLSTVDTVCFELVLSKKNYNIARQGGGLLQKFELTTTLSTSIELVDEPGGSIHVYHTIEDIIHSFARMRIGYYANRKEESLKIYQSRLNRLENQIRFIQCVLGREIVLDEGDLVWILRDKKFDEEPGGGYEYLLSFEIQSFTYEKLSVLQRNLEEVQDQINRLERETAESLWLKDLAALDKALESLQDSDEDISYVVDDSDDDDDDDDDYCFNNQLEREIGLPLWLKDLAAMDEDLEEEEEREGEEDTVVKSKQFAGSFAGKSQEMETDAPKAVATKPLT